MPNRVYVVIRKSDRQKVIFCQQLAVSSMVGNMEHVSGWRAASGGRGAAVGRLHVNLGVQAVQSAIRISIPHSLPQSPG